jgi:hypothetical protein
MADLDLYRRIAFAAAACSRARYIFAICHGATPVATVDWALAQLWKGLALDEDIAAIRGVYGPLTEVPESGVDDTLDREWLAWLTLATFEFPAALTTSGLPVQQLAQCSSLMLTIMGEIDLRLGWDGAPHEGKLARLEWAAQIRCRDILTADPSGLEIPVEGLLAAGRDLGLAIAEASEALAAATGWRLWPPVA